ncbi:hypothetical protein C8J57DRAFT_1721212 [Mycena rebaudengoi]|nr:hypothetical protein C8J57DRAFT_1721212 [Mycena rebaudengoi]
MGRYPARPLLAYKTNYYLQSQYPPIVSSRWTVFVHSFKNIIIHFAYASNESILGAPPVVTPSWTLARTPPVSIECPLMNVILIAHPVSLWLYNLARRTDNIIGLVATMLAAECARNRHVGL